MLRKYSEEQLTKAILMVIDQGLSTMEVSKRTGINKRAIQRYKSRYIEDRDDPEIQKTTDIAFRGDIPGVNSKVQKQLESTMLDRAHFLDDVFETKQIVLQQIRKISKKSQNLDALQRTVKTLNDIEKEVIPEGEGDNPAFHAKTVNVFQLFNNKLISDGYKGPELTDADIVKND